MIRALIIALALALTACAAELPELKNGATLAVSQLGAAKPPIILRPESVEYRRLIGWINENRAGWTQHYATRPSTGILITTDSFVIHFVGKKAIAVLQHGAYEKDVTEGEYEYLRSAGA